MQQRQSLSQGLNLGLKQGLKMTPQLVQSIKLLQMSSAELLRHIEDQIERNPLLELSEEDNRPGREERIRNDDDVYDGSYRADGKGENGSDPVIAGELDTSRGALESNLDTSFENEFDTDRSGGDAGVSPVAGKERIPGGGQGTDFSRNADDAYNLEEFIAGSVTLQEHLGAQLALSRVSPAIRLAANEIIHALDSDGYFRGQLKEIALERKLSPQDVEEGLTLVQSFEPVGVGARDLSECLKLQLREKNRLDPAIACLLDNLEMLAKRDFSGLSELCGLSLDEVLDMVDEIRSLDPHPAAGFESVPSQSVEPDAFVRELPDGSFTVELNGNTLPKVLVNNTYESVISRNGNAEEDRFIADCLSDANWLVKSLEQRAQTILKVVTEIVRQQDGFFAHGIAHLRPMSLKQVADAIGMHESTVSRVTTSKYVLTNRGMFELKFFFTAALSANDGGEAHSAEAVRQRIRALIDAESPQKVLSDDALVAELAAQGVNVARRTVAKYREGMNIASSVERRREKRAQAARRA